MTSYFFKCLTAISISIWTPAPSSKPIRFADPLFRVPCMHMLLALLKLLLFVPSVILLLEFLENPNGKQICLLEFLKSYLWCKDSVKKLKMVGGGGLEKRMVLFTYTVFRYGISFFFFFS